MCGSPLKPDKQDSGLRSRLLFSELVFQVSKSVGTADILGDASAEWETQLSVSIARKKYEMTLHLLLKRSQPHIY